MHYCPICMEPCDCDCEDINLCECCDPDVLTDEQKHEVIQKVISRLPVPHDVVPDASPKMTGRYPNK
jgi:hypothetical protein